MREFGEKNFPNTTIFAEALGMTQPSLSQYLNNKRSPGAGILQRLRELGCDLNWLLSDDPVICIVSEPRVNYGEPNKLKKELEAIRSAVQRLEQLINNQTGDNDGKETPK